MNNLKEYLAELKEREAKATEGLSFVNNDRQDDLVNECFNQVTECYNLTKKDIPKLIRIVEVMREALEFYASKCDDFLYTKEQWDNGFRYQHEAEKALKKAEEVLSE